MKKTLFAFMLICALVILAGCSRDTKSNGTRSETNEKSEPGKETTENNEKQYSAQIDYILDNPDDCIAPSYEGSSDVGIFHMLGVRVYSFVNEKEDYFAQSENEKLMVTAAKYFIFAAESEKELCKEMQTSDDIDISILADKDIFEKRPLFIHAPVKASDDLYQVDLEYVLSSQGADVSAEERTHVVIELTMSDENIYITKIS